MVNFHTFLHQIFQKRLTFSIFFRIWLAIAIVVILASSLAFYQLQKSIKPSAQRVVEDTLVDISRMLSVTLSAGMQSGYIQTNAFQKQFADAFAPTFNGDNEPVWYDQKTQSQLHVYITNKQGIVIYDSKQQNIGKDFSRWNDVYLTLQGKYGARSSRKNPDDPSTSVMYVASPIYDNNHQLIGVVSVGKPVITISPYLEASKKDMIKTLLYITGLVLLFAGIVAWWLRYSIHVVNRYTQALAPSAKPSHHKINPPHFYLGKELNDLVSTIDEMKHTIENKAYVTDYVHTLTHELKSPLTAIRASGELLGEDLPPQDREQFSQTILKQSDKLQQLIERMLILAKIEQPNFKLTLKSQLIFPLIEQCFINQQAWLQQVYQQNFIWEIIGDKQTNCLIDKFWLQQALQNIIDNAIKFAESFVLVVIEKKDKQLQIYCMNDCEKIADYIIDKAFDRYFSVSSSQQNKNVKGTGLGLTLVKQVLEHHQGNVTIYQNNLVDILKKIDKKFLDNQFDKCKFENKNVICVQINLPI